MSEDMLSIINKDKEDNPTPTTKPMPGPSYSTPTGQEIEEKVVYNLSVRKNKHHYKQVVVMIGEVS